MKSNPRESGRLVEILLQVDQEARVGDRIAWLENDLPWRHGRYGVGAVLRAAVSQTATASLPAASAVSPTSASRRSEVKIASDATPERPHGRIKSSPVARRLAAQHAVDFRQITGTGPRGRVQLIDVRRAIEAQSAPGAAGPAAPGIQPLSGMRRALARSMTLSNATIPQFVVERAVDWTALKAVRAKVVAQLPAGAPKPSVNDFLLQGIARTLLSFPALNATFSGDADSPDAGIVSGQRRSYRAGGRG